MIGTFNNSATLTCIADGHPLPTISWFKGAIKLEDINKYFTSNNVSEGFRKEMYPGIMQVTSSLIIRDLQTADSGIYTCQAQSSGTPGTPLSTPYQLLVTDGTHTHLHIYTHVHTHTLLVVYAMLDMKALNVICVS